MYRFSFEKLDVWKESALLVKKIYKITDSFPTSEKYGLISQLRRASISISSNLAEGTSRNTNKDKAYFSTITYSSTMEVLNQLILAKELNFFLEDDYLDLRNQIYKISNMINALRKYQLK